MKTTEEFLAATGRMPAYDDLDRVNCRHAGDTGHKNCGWCEKHNGPAYECQINFNGYCNHKEPAP